MKKLVQKLEFKECFAERVKKGFKLKNEKKKLMNLQICKNMMGLIKLFQKKYTNSY